MAKQNIQEKHTYEVTPHEAFRKKGDAPNYLMFVTRYDEWVAYGYKVDPNTKETTGPEIMAHHDNAKFKAVKMQVVLVPPPQLPGLPPPGDLCNACNEFLERWDVIRSHQKTLEEIEQRIFKVMAEEKREEVVIQGSDGEQHRFWIEKARKKLKHKKMVTLQKKAEKA